MGEAKEEEAKVEAKPEEKKEEKQVEKKEEKKEEKAEEEKKEEAKPPSPPPPIVLYVDLHCVGCAKKIERSIIKCRGVEGVEMDMAQNKVTIKGIVDPQALCSRIQKKTMREAEVLSPLPPAEGESKPEVVASQVSGITTVELRVNMHCEACAQQLRKKILKMRGVQTAETDLSSGKVTVTGTMDGNRLVDYVYRRTGKLAKLVPQPPKEEEKKEEGEKKEEEKPPEEEEKEEKKEEEKEAEQQAGGEGKKEGEKKEEETKKEGEAKPAAGGAISEEDMAKKMMYYWGPPVYVIERLPPPQLFSDENPNACCIS